MDKPIWIIIFILIAEILIVAVAIGPEHVKEENKKELRIIVKWFGKEKAKEMYLSSRDNFNWMFKDSGIVKGSYSFLLPNNENKYKNKGVERMDSSPIWAAIQRRIDSFWIVIKSGFLRFELLLLCLLHCLPFLIPVVIDGLMKREICKLSEDNASLPIYTLSKYTFNFCLIGPPVLFLLPFSISPIYVGVWALLFASSSWLMSSNVQHRI
jgi:hypothetical protein